MLPNQLFNRPGCRSLSITIAAIFAVSIAGCNGAKSEKEPDCVPAVDENGKPIKKKVEKFGLRIGEKNIDTSGDWCRACVMSLKGFASCQKVYETKEGENRETLRAKAKEKACLDAQYPKDACPDPAIISITCKDEAPPPGTMPAGEALQNLFLGTKKSEAKGQEPQPKENKPADPSEKKTKPVIE